MDTLLYILCICCDISDRKGLILVTFGTVISYQVLAMHAKYSNYTNIFLNVMFVARSQKKTWVDFVYIWYRINHNRDLMHVKYTLALCQNVAFMSIISYTLYVVIFLR